MNKAPFGASPFSAAPHRTRPSHPHQASRARHVTAVLGPTNTGKTHLAIERMLGHETGLIGLPLRLLAREVYDKIKARAGEANVALITGEEKIKPPHARYYVCTVEAMPADLTVDFLAVDEIQLAADAERGHVFTNRLLHARGQQETLLLGAATMKQTLKALLPEAHIISRPRLSQLRYAGQKKLSRLPRRSAIVAFSANEVYEIAELIRRQRGGAAVVLGALSPRTRNAQVALYQSGDVDFLVATDAIGMGLNLAVDHVAFASVRKFDGFSHRNLSLGELGQIAGRAGRYLNDGTFGVTGKAIPFSQDMVLRLEEHNFEPVKTLQWRNDNLDYSSLIRLKDSLSALPDRPDPRLVRARPATDVIALEILSRNDSVRQRATAPAAIRLLWELCQIPDYRKISSSHHAELIATLYKFLIDEPQILPEEWFAQQVAFADNVRGDIDTLANRIAHIRTWTFVANRPKWLKDPEYWQEKTKEIENRLSDALHNALTKRFIDKRTSVLMRQLRDKNELTAKIGADGAIHVENHFVGRLDGFNFTPDSDSNDLHGKAARHAAVKVLAQELAERADRLSKARDEAFQLSRTGTISWEGSAVARLEASDTPLRPDIHVLADDHLQASDREKIKNRLRIFLDDHIFKLIEPLVKLADADDIEGLGRGLAFQLVENFGSLNRLDVAEEVKQLDQPQRGQLRRYGVRFGAYNIFIPSLLKPAASELILLLWALRDGEKHGIIAADLPMPPRAGLTSVVRDKALPDAFYRAAGYHPCGNRVVRLDILERLGDLIRPLLYWRKSEATPVRPEASVPGGGFRVTPDMLSILGCGHEEMTDVLKALGYRLERRPKKLLPAKKPLTAIEQEVLDAALSQLAPYIDIDLSSQKANRHAPVPAQPGDASTKPEMEEIWRLKPKHSPARREHDRKAHGAASGTGRKRPSRRQGGKLGEAKKPSPRKTHAKGANKARQGARGSNRPRTITAAPPKRKDKAVSDSPFAALTALKEKLQNSATNKDT